MRKCFLFLSVFTIVAACKKSTQGTDTNTTDNVTKDSVITTLAGNGTFGFSGDGGLATSAQLSTTCRRVCVDDAGNVYLSDIGNSRIRKVTTAGIIITVAGTGTDGYSGDSGPATSAKINVPEGLTTDAAGNLYFADRLNNVIRKITPAGTITTIAGKKNPVSSQHLGDGGLATSDSANLSQPCDIALDAAGNLFISDYASHRIRKVNAATGILTTIAGNGTQSYTGDGGLAVNAGVQYPEGIALDGAGNLYISTDQRIRKVSTAGIITTVAGTGNGAFNVAEGNATSVNIWPVGLAINNKGDIIIANYANGYIRKVDANGYMTTIAGGGSALGDGGKPKLAKLDYPTGVCFDKIGNIFIADYGARRIRKIAVK